MTLSTLDPITALVVIDMQQGIVGAPFAHPIGPVIARTQALVQAFRAHRLPVILVNVAGVAPGRTEQPPRHREPLPPGWTDFIPELTPQADDIVVTKRTWGAFASTDLEARLKARAVTQIVLAGVSTGTGVESTARQAYELGLNVSLAIDAMTDVRPQAHAYSLAQVFPRLGESGLAQDVLDLLDTRNH